jgi:ABC-type Fe3+ transport system substrate-binding protein
MNTQWMSRLRRLAGGLLLAASLSAAPPAARAADERVVVLTSYPEELTVRFQAAFERLHPGKRVEVLWRQSADALAYLRRGGAREVDVYWTPAPGNFVALRDEGKLAKLNIDRDALPADIAGFPISDPDGNFAAFELAGHGIAYNIEAVRKLGLRAPRDWSDLTAPAYAHQVQIPIPGRVGFAPVLIEAVLQGQGWERGWAVLSEIAGNADFGAGDSAPGADDIVAGRKAARMSIDFFAATAIAAGAPLGFAYPPRTAYSPAQIAVLADAPHPALARQFVAFALSAEGQQLLLHPDVRRLPVRRDLYAAHPELSAQPFAAGNLGYDGALGRARQGLVAALFEQALVQRHGELAALWQAVHAAEAAGRRNDPAIIKARALLAAAPVSEIVQADPVLRRGFAFPDGVPVAASASVGATPAVSVGSREAIEAGWREALAARIDAVNTVLRDKAL